MGHPGTIVNPLARSALGSAAISPTTMPMSKSTRATDIKGASVLSWPRTATQAPRAASGPCAGGVVHGVRVLDIALRTARFGTRRRLV